MYASVITSAKKATLQEDGTMFLDVKFNIYEDEGVIDTKRLAFPTSASPKSIMEEVKRYTENYGAEISAAIINSEKDTELAEADATIEGIIGKKVIIK